LSFYRNTILTGFESTRRISTWSKHVKSTKLGTHRQKKAKTGNVWPSAIQFTWTWSTGDAAMGCALKPLGDPPKAQPWFPHPISVAPTPFGADMDITAKQAEKQS